MPSITGFRHSEVEADSFRRTRTRHPDCGITITLTQHDQASGGRFDERLTGLDHLALSRGRLLLLVHGSRGTCRGCRPARGR